MHGTVPGGPVEWLACVAAWTAVGPIAITAGTSAATRATANKAIIFDFMFVLNETLGFRQYKSRCLNGRIITKSTREDGNECIPGLDWAICSYNSIIAARK